MFLPKRARTSGPNTQTLLKLLMVLTNQESIRTALLSTELSICTSDQVRAQPTAVNLPMTQTVVNFRGETLADSMPS